ncbi:hypothetical protein ADK91_08615, partial [Streptomyces sp. XY511]
GSRSGRRTPGRGRRIPPTTAAAVAATLLACAGAVYYLDGPVGDETGTGGSSATPSHPPTASGPASPSPSAAESASGYVPGYVRARLTAPDSGYEFDLKAGKVVAAETATWYLARDGRAFLPSEDSDAFVIEAGDLTVAACVRGIETRPAAALPFDVLAKERPFCVRSPDRGEIAIVRLVEAAADGSVTIVADQYRRS